MPKKNILLAMFDIRPNQKLASLVLDQMDRELNLRKQETFDQQEDRPAISNIQAPVDSIQPQIKTVVEKSPEPKAKLANEEYWEELISILPQRPDFPIKFQSARLTKTDILKELEKTISEPMDVEAELSNVGGTVHNDVPRNPKAEVIKYKKEDLEDEIEADSLNDTEVETILAYEMDPELTDSEANVELENFWQKNQSQEVYAEPVIASHTPASREIEVWLDNLQKNRKLLSKESASYNKQKSYSHISHKPKTRWSSWFRFNRRAMVYIVSISLPGLLAIGLLKHEGNWARSNVIQNGNNAAANFENAKQELEGFNFMKAADSFALAYDDLNKASGTLNQLGASFISAFGNLPGLSKVKAANNIVEAGQSLSKSGENLSLAFGTLYKTNPLSFLGSSGSSQGASLSKLLTEFKDILVFADKNVKKADGLLSDIDSSVIPPDKQELFNNFKDKVPEFQKYIGQAVDYSDFLLKFVGASGPKTYLILLENNSELRPTGGFPGTYGLITFEDGALKKTFVEDIYRADANLKVNIIPPKPLQHITPNWGMRDAAWFADFPTSAKKVIQFYKLDGGPNVDGVLTITPDVITKILDVIGPINMPEYKLTLKSDNFMAAIQNEVEYQADRSAPKQILSDLQPKFFERLAQQDKEHWLSIFKIISEAEQQKHILAYFNDPDLEKVAKENGIAGEIKNVSPENDYLQVVFANVKGSKTDFVTENSMNLTTEKNEGGNLEHTLTISRIHNGGDSKYGFYNRDNPAYIKVYVPQGSTLESINGQSITDFKPLISYEDFGFKKDPDLSVIENNTITPFTGTDVFEESGRTVFGFWIVIRPGNSKTVTLKYSTKNQMADDSYHLLWQKQSGTVSDKMIFNFKIPDGKQLESNTDGGQLMGNNFIFNSDLSTDRLIDIQLK